MAIAAIRTIILYILLMIAMRLMGKRQLGELQPSELAVTMLLSDLAAVPMQDNGLPLFNGIIPILVLVSLEIILSGLMLKFPVVSKAVAGSPIAVIKDGRIDKAAMRRLRMTVDDLAEALRQENVFDIRQVQYAIVETNGHISAFCHPPYQTTTLEDMGVKVKDNGLPMVVISDGKCMPWGLQMCDLDEKWLAKTLQKMHCTIEDVFIMTATKTGDFFLLKNKDVTASEGKH